VWTLYHRAWDNAGNENELPAQTIKVDNTSPITSLTIGDPKFGSAPTYVSLATTFTLTATDDLSGVDNTEYRFGGPGTWTLYTGAFTAPDIGSYTLYYRSIDNAGNTEPENSVWIIVGATTVTYTGDNNGQYSDPVTLSAILIDNATQLPISGETISFVIENLSITAIKITTTAITDDNGIATVTIIENLLPAGSYKVSATFAGNAVNLGSSDNRIFIINKENATVNYTGDTIVPTTAGTINLRATVFDSADSYWGDLTKIKVTFRIYTTPININSPYRVVGPVTVSTTDTPGVGVATSATGNLPEDSYVVIVSIDPSNNNYYCGPTSDPTTITVYEPTSSYVTGGGWITENTGNKGNFGFVVRYNKSKQVKGQSVYVYRIAGWDYVIKSNAWIGLAIDNTHASFQGKCTVQMYDPSTGQLIADNGNYTFRVDAIDNNAAKGMDVYQIRVLDKNGVLYHEAGFNPYGYLQGGNIIIHK
jgi:hypothetical protein